jgi:hypothetical protein
VCGLRSAGGVADVHRASDARRAPAAGTRRESAAEALTSCYSLFGTTRGILRTHGPRGAQPHHGSDLSFGYLALAVLNGVLRPILWPGAASCWPRSNSVPRANQSSAGSAPGRHADSLRQQVDAARDALLDYADVLAQVADVPPLHVR